MREPIAVVSMSCRFGANVRSVGDMWEVLAAGRDTIGEMPTDRGWDLRRLHGTNGNRALSVTRFGSFIPDAADFDAAFFGISPREAVAMEPQQRVLLETSWEALERAGIDPRTLRGSRTGVYFGVMQAEYGPRMADMQRTKGYQDTGIAASVASGRVAYVLGLRGPSLSLDTACSSSLVAIHTAMKALQSGECSLALAGGGTIHSSASLFVGFSLMRVLSKDGTTRPFSSDATGFGLGEGIGVLVLERLSDARRHGHPVLAVLRGSAVVSDGASAGLTTPDQDAQQEAIEYALADAGLSAADVDVVEAHGTGTQIGDPIEVTALASTYGAAHTAEHPVWIGSVKSNFGHTQAGSGVAGMIKMVESIRRGIVPATVHFSVPSPHVDWSAGTVRVAGELMAWPGSSGAPRRGAVSANGISGVNCHVIVEQAPTLPGSPLPRRALSVVPLPLSANTGVALAAQARQVSALMRRRPDLDPTDIGYSLATGRATLGTRAVVLGTDRGDLIAGLDEIAARGPDGPGSRTGDHGVVLVFPGQGSQWSGMAVELLETSEIFAEQVSLCDAALSEFQDWSVAAVLRAERNAPPFEGADIVQPVLFTVMVALARMWESLGVRPSAVIGHSQGEIAAAHVSGALTLRDAALVVARRSQAIATIAGGGGMVHVPLPADQAVALTDNELVVACVNSPFSCVLSGSTDAVENLLAACAADGVDARRVDVDFPSHSPLVESLERLIETALGTVTPVTSRVPFLSTVTGGDQLDTAQLDAAYWYRNLRESVLFEDAVRSAYRDGARVFLEVSAHPVLSLAVRDTLFALGSDSGTATVSTVVATLRRGEGGPARFLASAAQLYSAGVPVNWSSWFVGSGARRVDLPTYPFQGQRFWMMPDEGMAHAADSTESLERDPVSLGEFTDAREHFIDLETVAVVQSAVAHVLGYHHGELVDATSTFKELGLDSLAALALRHRLEAVSGIRFGATDLVDHPTPIALAALLHDEPAAATTNPVDSLPDWSTVESWPLTPYQADVVVVGARYPDQPVVQAAHYLRIAGATDVDKLRAAIMQQFLRHPVLRVWFDLDTVPPTQCLGATPDQIEFVDLLSEADPAAALALWTRERADTVLPKEGPQIEFAVLRTSSDSLIVFSRFHHAVADGWSSILIAHEIAAVYFGDELPTLAPNFLVRLDEYGAYRDSDQWQTDRDALIERFSGLTPAIFDPTSVGRPSRRLHHFARTFDHSSVDRIRASGSKVSLILAAIGIQLHRLHRNGDIVIGVSLLNRETPAELVMVGNLANILPVHIPTTEASSLTDIAAVVETQLRDLQGRQRFPYGDLLRGLRNITGASPALFDIRLTYNTVPDHEHVMQLRQDVTTLAAGNTLGAATIVVNEYASDGTLDVELFYDADLFDDTLLQTVFHRVIDSLSEAVPPRPIAALVPCFPREVSVLTGATTDLDSNLTVPELLSRTASESPGQIAVTWMAPDNQVTSLTYRELNDRVRALAAALRENGLQTGGFVAVLLPRSPELVIAVHAIMAAGGAYLPVAIDYPTQRIRTLLADSGARLLISSPNQAGEFGIEVITPDALPTRWPAPATVRPNDLAYLIYTSGSTGIPKGVMIEHRSVINLLSWLQRHFRLTVKDVVLFKAPHTFDASIPELVWPIQATAQLAVLPDATHLDPREIIRAIDFHGVTVVQFVPSMFGPFLDELEATPDATHRIRTLRYILCGGEALRPALVRRFGEIFSAAGLDDVILTNLWGPTETTYCASYFDITVTDARKITNVPIGTPVDNTTIAVIDSNELPVAPGMTGELAITGIAVARGYHNREDDTAKAFTTAPDSLDLRRYRTGDLGRHNNDSQLEYQGRVDDQIKVRGHRVTLGEVATHITNCPRVTTATVLDSTSTTGQTALTAYYTGTASPEEIAAFLRDCLPNHAIPTNYISVPSIPLTHNGKTDTAALRQKFYSRPEQPNSLSQSEIEAILTDAWTEVLGTPDPDPTADFFLTGGDSIAALQLRAAIERRNLQLELNDLFTHPSIRALALGLSERRLI